VSEDAALSASTAVAVGVVDAEAATNVVSVDSGATVTSGAVEPESVKVTPSALVSELESVPLPVAVTVTDSPTVLSTRK
jgi:hypothetical protein